MDFLQARTPTNSLPDVKTGRGTPRSLYTLLNMCMSLFCLLHQRHGRIQERSGPEMYTVSCATSSLLPLLWAHSFHRVGFGRCSPSTTSTTQRTSPFPNPRRPLVSAEIRSMETPLRVRPYSSSEVQSRLHQLPDGTTTSYTAYRYPTSLQGDSI